MAEWEKCGLWLWTEAIMTKLLLFVGWISYLSHKVAVRIKALIFVTARRVLFSFHRERSMGESLWTRNLAIRYSDFVFANQFAWDLALQGCRRKINHGSCWYRWKLMSWTSSGVLELCYPQVFPGSPCSPTLHTDYFKCSPLSKPSYPPSSPAPSHAVPSVFLPVRIFLRHRFLLNVEPWLFLLFHPVCEVCLVLLLIKVYSWDCLIYVSLEVLDQLFFSEADRYTSGSDSSFSFCTSIFNTVR